MKKAKRKMGHGLKNQGENRSFLRLGPHKDASLVQMHDLPGQTQPDPVTVFLGCEERHKDLIQDIRHDACAIILEINDYPV